MFGEGSNNFFMIIVLYVVVIGGLWFFMIRPQSKKKKQEEEMRNNVKIGDEIITIGGIVGRIINIKNESDSIVIETGVDRSKIRLKRWAIASCISEEEK